MNVADHVATPRRRPNPPGLDKIAFRVGNQAVFLRWMRRQLRQNVLRLPGHPDATELQNPLKALNPRDDHAFVQSLLSAWAVVGDVLTFYQERIANEGYLATAIERFSLHQFVRSIGYKPRPALSATTHLAFTLLEARRSVDQAPTSAPAKPSRRWGAGAFVVDNLAVPRGTSVQSVPSPGQKTVTFETTADIQARTEWNAMAPLLRPPEIKPQICGGVTKVQVAGKTSDLRPGTPIVLHGNSPETGQPVLIVRLLSSIEPNADGGGTWLIWEKPLEGAHGVTLMDAPEVVVFHQAAKLFGDTAPDWTKQPDAVKAGAKATRIGAIAIAPLLGSNWTSVAASFPPGDVRALAIDQEKRIFAAVGNAVMACSNGQDWIVTGPLPASGVPTVLLAPENGLLYAGTQRGDVLCSTDHGQSWFSIVGSATPAAAGIPAVLPGAPIRTLAISDATSATATVLAGTAFGIWHGTANGGPWTAWNAGLPGYEEKLGNAAVAVNALVHDPVSDHWAAATDQGLFYSAGIGRNWHHASMKSAPARHAPSAVEAASEGGAGRSVWEDITGVFRGLRLTSASTPASGPVAPTPPAQSASPTPAGSRSPTAAEPASAPSGPVSKPASPPSSSEPGAVFSTIHALTVWRDASAHPTLFAGTERGVVHSTDGGRTWSATAKSPGGDEVAVDRLAAGPGALVAGCSSGLFQSTDGGANWMASGPFAGAHVAALAVGSGLQAAAAPFGGYLDKDWPGLLVSGKELDLDRAYTALVPGSWIAFIQDRKLPEGGSHLDMLAYQVDTMSIFMRRDFTLNTRVSHIALRDQALPYPLDPRITSVYIFSRVLTLQEQAEENVQILGIEFSARPGGSADEPTATITLAGAYTDLEKRWISISGRRVGALLVGNAGGVRRWDGKQWTRVGSSNLDAQALLVTGGGEILMGCQSGVVRFDGNDWQRLGDCNQIIDALAEAHDGAILAGTDHGLWRWFDNKWSQCGLADHRVLALLLLDGSRIIAGTDHGLQLSANGGESWAAANGAIADNKVNALASAQSGAVIAATDDGVFYCEGDDWSGAVQNLSGRKVHALAINTHGKIYAGTSEGLVRSNDGLHWSPDGPELDNPPDIRALAVDPATSTVYAAQRGVGVIAGRRPIPAGIANDVRSLAFDRDGRLLAGSLSASVLQSSSDRSAVLEPVHITDLADPILASRLTHGGISADVRNIFIKGGITLPDDAVVSEVEAGVTWTILGGGGTSYTLHALGPAGVRVFLNNALELMAPTTTVAGRPDLEIWRVRNKAGVTADLMAVSGEIIYATAWSSGETVAEIRHVTDASVNPDRSGTTVWLNAPFANVYDGTTVSCNANVAPAVHGETPVLFEAIGSGDRSLPNQKFSLRQNPITVLPAKTGFDWNYNIQIRVLASLSRRPLQLNEQLVRRHAEEQSVPWQRRATLAESGPDDPHYVVSEDDAGAVSVTFGDGVHGKRLPTGKENVIAHYSVGSGPSGNVGAGSLTLLRNRPAGVRSATNPVAATGGTPKESSRAMRTLAPLSLRSFGRIVSLGDYADFARAWPGIAKAAARLVRLPDQSTKIHLTVANTVDPLPAAASGHTPASDNGPPLYADLLEAIKNSCAENFSLQIDACVQLGFKVAAKIKLAPDQEWTLVSDAVTDTLLDRFGFGRRNIAESVKPTELIAAIQEVEGVEAVQLTAFYRRGWQPSFSSMIPAAAAQWNAVDQRIDPAELLIIKEAGDITPVLDDT